MLKTKIQKVGLKCTIPQNCRPQETFCIASNTKPIYVWQCCCNTLIHHIFVASIHHGDEMFKVTNKQMISLKWTLSLTFGFSDWFHDQSLIDL